MREPKKSYGSILKSTSLTGGSQMLSTIIGMLRTKFAAVLLGPAGIGLIGTYTAIQQFVISLAGMGINQSGVRDISSARATGDQLRVAETVYVVRKLSLWFGIAGALIVILISWPLSRFTFGDTGHALPIMALGISVMITLVSAAQSAVVRGYRRIAELARISVASSAIGTLSAVIFYYFLGINGIIPAILLQSVITLVLSWRASRRIAIQKVKLSWSQIRVHAKSLLGLGLAFMWTALLGAALAYLVRLILAREFDLTVVGIYAAAYAISVSLVAMVTNAMGADYLPRLSEVSEDSNKMAQLVNEQAEIGILLGLPMMFGLILFAEVLIKLLFTTEFLAALPLIHLFALGCFVRVFTWPMGFVLIAKKRSALFAKLQSAFFVTHLIMIYFLIRQFGPVGVALAFSLNTIISFSVVYVAARRLIRFRWTVSAFRLVAFSSVAMLSVFFAVHFIDDLLVFVAFTIVWLALSICSVRSICKLVSDNSRVIKALERLPKFIRSFLVPNVSE